MGIPFYFSNITKSHPDIINSNINNTEYLFLDFNCAIHYCSNKIKSNEQYDILNHEEILINECVKYITKITTNIKVNKLLYISIDGVVPFAKMTQQRKRRYLSVWKNNKLNIKSWDSNAISPGTEFMNKLNITLKGLVDSNKNDYKIIVSDTEEPGEGETKIFNYITEAKITNEKITIYGLDADLIMLSMLIGNKNNIYLMRESEFYRFKILSDFLYMDIDLLKKELKTYIDSTMESNKIKNKIETYIVICFLIGNDFVPSLSYLKIKNGSIDFMMHVLCQVMIPDEELMYFNSSNNQWELNWILFSRFINQLANYEDHDYAKNHEKYYSQTRRRPANDAEYYENYGLYVKPIDSIRPHEDGWRHRYYKALFPPVKVDNVCRKYIEGIKWNIEYYFNKKCYTKWFYTFDYSPTLFDLNNFIIVNDVNTIAYNDSVDYLTSSEHLLRILPKSSSYLLNDSQQRIIGEYKYAKYYPVDFKIQTYMKHYLHDCIPILPQMQFDTLL
jgi:5'-3' exonuclease